MYNKEFIFKYIFRTIHMLTVVIIGGNAIFSYLFPCIQTPPLTGSSIAFNTICGLLMMISGFINIFILKVKSKIGD